MKINASDEPNQISNYYYDLMEKASSEKVKIYYLALNGKSASKESLEVSEKNKNNGYIKRSFSTHILNWPKECQKQVSNITNLNNAIGYYTDVVNILIGEYTSPINEYKDFF